MARDRPLSRVESQERTKQALLDAAERRFLNDGYFRTTVTQIAADAGVTKGAVYANFASKAELFMGVRRRWARRGLNDLHGVFATVTDIDGFVERGVEWMTDFGVATEARQRAVVEFLVDAEGTSISEEFLDGFHATRDNLRELVADTIPRLTGREVDEANLALQVEVFLAAVRGVAVHRRIDPSIPVDTYGLALRNLASGVLATLLDD